MQRGIVMTEDQEDEKKDLNNDKPEINRGVELLLRNRRNVQPKPTFQLKLSLFNMMKNEKTIEGLNEKVIIPFITAMEDICAARGYVLNIYGERSNLIFTRKAKEAEDINKLVEDYLSNKG